MQTTLQLLLIEDNPADATEFINRIQARYPDGVAIAWKQTLETAFKHLKSHEVDQIWIDKELPELGRSNIAEVLSALKTYIDPSELYLLSISDSSTETLRDAKLVVKTGRDGDSQRILEIVTQLLQKRSSGTTQVHFAKMEGQLAKLEYRVDKLDEALRGLPQKLEEIIIEQRLLKDLASRIPAIGEKISELESRVREQGSTAVTAVEKWKAIGGIAAAVLGVVGVGLSIIVPIVLPKLLEGEVKQEIKQHVKEDLKRDAGTGDR